MILSVRSALTTKVLFDHATSRGKPLVKVGTTSEVRGGWRFHCDSGERDHELFGQLERFVAGTEGQQNWEQIASSLTARAWRLKSGSNEYVLKEFLRRGPFEYVKSVFRGSRAQKAHDGGMMLLSSGFLTPKMPVWGEKSIFAVATRSFLVTSFVKGSAGFYSLLRAHFQPPLNPERVKIKRSIIASLGFLVGRLHSQGVVHGDLRLDNILVKGWEGGSPEFYLIDNERNSCHRKIPERLLLKNLVQLNMIGSGLVTRTDRMRFFNNYLLTMRDLLPRKKTIAREVWSRTVRRLRKKYGEG